MMPSMVPMTTGDEGAAEADGEGDAGAEDDAAEHVAPSGSVPKMKGKPTGELFSSRARAMGGHVAQFQVLLKRVEGRDQFGADRRNQYQSENHGDCY